MQVQKNLVGKTWEIVHKRVKNALGIALVLLLFGFVSCKDKDRMEPFGPPESGIVEGTVTDAQNGVFIAGATITSSFGESVLTDPRGRYEMRLPSGDHMLTVTKAGFTTTTATVHVKEGRKERLDFSITEETVTVPSMVLVAGGTFQMGSNEGYADELPVHSVTVSSFYIGKYEVTQKEWVEIMGSNRSYFQGDTLPVEQVTWFEVVNFCNQKSIHDGLTPVYDINGVTVTADWNANGYRLPTEAEWEYAARGGSQSSGYTFSGSNVIGGVAWYWGNAGSTTHAVGTKSPNELGLYDMSGNVWEFCWDWDGPFTADAQTDPKGPESGTERVLHGGNWLNGTEECRVTNRFGFYPGLRDVGLGFRLAQKGN